MAAECELEVGAGICGVLAIGRCATCTRPFCTSHRALTDTGPIVDQCVSCRAALVAHEREQRAAQYQAGEAAQQQARQAAYATVRPMEFEDLVEYLRYGRAAGFRLEATTAATVARAARRASTGPANARLGSGLTAKRGWGMGSYFVSRAGHVYEVDRTRRPWAAKRRLGPQELLDSDGLGQLNGFVLWGRAVDDSRGT